MDARPQRPVRNMRVLNDENCPPEGALPKTIHHRNKSSPALTGPGAGGNFKGAAKRTAFGDVSNIVTNKRTSKDDTAVLTKFGVKTTHVVQEKKSAAFLRPAQRPLSVTGLKTFLTGSSHADNSSKIPLNDSSSQPSVNSRKVLSKRNTTIFKDNSLDTVQENEPAQKKRQPSISNIQAILPDHQIPELGVSIPDSKLYLPHPVSHSVVDPIKHAQPFPSDFSLPSIDEVNLDDSETLSDGVILDNVNTVLNKNATEDFVPAPTPLEPSSLAEPVLPSTSITTVLRNVDAVTIPIVDTQLLAESLPELYSQASQLLSAPEPEEYWEEEEDEGYEEEGYVTARSFRSKGDNTTGGATTILFPQMNGKVRNEIAAATKIVEATRTPEEVEDESYDTSMVAEYGEEIFDYMRQLEVKMMPNAHYMDNQHEIQWSMRTVLMDWLVQVHHRFNLLPETLFLCVNYIDRFLSCKVVSLGKLQLVGATAIFIAAKYEEINCPSVQEIVYMVDGGYSVDEILKAERFMLTMLQFELGWPGPMSFLRRISKADDYDLETRTLAKYFLEVTLMDERFIGSPPSFTAAASHCLARMMLRKGSWSPHHVHYSGYTFSQLKPLLKLILECCEDPRKHHGAVFNKYCDKRYKRASAFVETEVQRGFQLLEPVIPIPLVNQPMMFNYTNGGFYA